MAERTCSVDECEKPVHARGWCGMHHRRWYTHGDPLMIGRSGPKVKNYPCSVTGCTKKRAGRGWCKEHWQRWSRTGTPYPRDRINTGDLTARLLSHLEIGLPDECWPFVPVGGRNDEGYGRLKVGDKYQLTHRLAYVLLVGPIPDGLLVCHSCDNPPCCNPSHLWVGTHGDNARDKVAKGRCVSGNAKKTHCPRGHPYDEANTIQYNGGRSCRACKRVSQVEYHSRKRAALSTLSS